MPGVQENLSTIAIDTQHANNFATPFKVEGVHAPGKKRERLPDRIAITVRVVPIVLFISVVSYLFDSHIYV